MGNELGKKTISDVAEEWQKEFQRPFKIHFIAGLPRTGSTLLCNILLQNPAFGCVATSGLIDPLITLRNNWTNWNWHKAMDPDLCKRIQFDVMRGMLFNYFKHEEPKQVMFDKNRGWLGHLEAVKTFYGSDFKVLVCVRELAEVLASFEVLWRRVSGSGQPPFELQQYCNARTALQRAQIMMTNDQPVGVSVNMVQDAVTRGFLPQMFFLDFDDLTSKPKEVMSKVHEFLGEPAFEYNFEAVEQKTKE
jgi:sulfotransferase